MEAGPFEALVSWKKSRVSAVVLTLMVAVLSSTVFFVCRVAVGASRAVPVTMAEMNFGSGRWLRIGKALVLLWEEMLIRCWLMLE